MIVINIETLEELVLDSIEKTPEVDGTVVSVSLGLGVVAGVEYDGQNLIAFIGDEPTIGYNPNAWMERQKFPVNERGYRHAEIWLDNKVADFQEENKD